MRLTILTLFCCSLIGLATQDPRPLTVTRVAAYGDDEPVVKGRSLTDAERKSGAGVLGRVSGAAEGRDGRVYVLDGMNNKVAVFTAKGEYLSSFGRLGEGPGEMKRAARIAAGPDGTILVFDADLKRMSEFSPDGKYLRQIPIRVANTTDMVVSDSLVWFTSMLMQAGRPHLVAYRLRDGARVDSIGGLPAREVQIASGGNPGRAVAAGRGNVLFVGPLPVQWRAYSGGTTRTLGTSLYRDAQFVSYPSAVGDVRSSNVAITGAVMTGSNLLVSYRRLEKIPTRAAAGEWSTWLGLWSAAGKELGRVDRTDDDLRLLSVARNGDVFVVSADSEIPQVLRVRVQAR